MNQISMQIKLETELDDEVRAINRQMKTEGKVNQKGNPVTKVDTVAILVEEAVEARAIADLPFTEVHESHGPHIDYLDVFTALNRDLKDMAVSHYAEAIANGEIDVDTAKKHYARILAFESLFADSKVGIKKQIIDFLLDQIPESEKVFHVENFLITRTSRTVYDYSNDGTWNELKSKVEQSNAELKQRESFLKTVKQPDALNGVNPQQELIGDELVDLYPPIEKKSDFFKTKLDA